MWPAILITAGVLFFIGQYNWDYSFWRLWPVLLIVIGIIQVLAATASTEGHVGPGAYYQNPQQPPPQSPPQAPPQR
jgi:hypothetical protein